VHEARKVEIQDRKNEQFQSRHIYVQRQEMKMTSTGSKKKTYKMKRGYVC